MNNREEVLPIASQMNSVISCLPGLLNHSFKHSDLTAPSVLYRNSHVSPYIHFSKKKKKSTHIHKKNKHDWGCHFVSRGYNQFQLCAINNFA